MTNESAKMQHKTTINDLPPEVITLFSSFLRRGKSLQDLTNFALASKLLYAASMSELYKIVHIYASQHREKKLINEEQFIRSITSNEQLGKHVRVLNIHDSPMRVASTPYLRSGFSCATSKYKFTEIEKRNVQTFIEKLTCFPIWDDFPIGQKTTYSRRKFMYRYSSGVDNFVTRTLKWERWRLSDTWTEDFWQGRADAMRAVLLAACTKVQALMMESWHDFSDRFIDVLSEDNDYVSRVFRGAHKTQLLVSDIKKFPGYTAGVFEEGLLYRLKEVSLPSSGFHHDMDHALALLQLPSTKRAQVSVVNGDGEDDRFKIPAELEVKLGIEHVYFRSSHCTTDSMVEFIRIAPRLRSFGYEHCFFERRDHTKCDHIAIIKALERTVCNTLEVMVLQSAFKDVRPNYTAAFGHLKETEVLDLSQFSVLKRLQLPITYLLQWNTEDAGYFVNHNYGHFDIDRINQRPRIPQVPLYWKLPSSLTTLEIIWTKKFHPGWVQIYTELIDLLEHAGEPKPNGMGTVARIRVIFLGQHLNPTLNLVGEETKLRQNCVRFLALADQMDVKVYTYNEDGMIRETRVPGEGRREIVTGERVSRIRLDDNDLDSDGEVDEDDDEEDLDPVAEAAPPNRNLLPLFHANLLQEPLALEDRMLQMNRQMEGIQQARVDQAVRLQELNAARARLAEINHGLRNLEADAPLPPAIVPAEMVNAVQANVQPAAPPRPVERAGHGGAQWWEDQREAIEMINAVARANPQPAVPRRLVEGPGPRMWVRHFDRPRVPAEMANTVQANIQAAIPPRPPRQYFPVPTAQHRLQQDRHAIHAGPLQALQDREREDFEEMMARWDEMPPLAEVLRPPPLEQHRQTMRIPAYPGARFPPVPERPGRGSDEEERL